MENIEIDKLPLVGPSYTKRLKKLEIETVWDLFHHIPARFLDFSKNKNIAGLQIGETATIKGVITSFANIYTKKGKPMQIVTIEDKTGKINAIWFNQIYLSRTLKEGNTVSIAGELSFFGRQKALMSPEYEIINSDGNQIHTGSLISIYPETAGISSKWLRRKIHDAWTVYKDNFEEFLPQEILKKYNLIDFREAIQEVHFPKTMDEFEKAKHRLAFNELLSLHLKNLKNKKEWQKNKVSSRLKVDNSKIVNFIKKLPFKLTNSQNKVIGEILADLEQDVPMNRLLEGDVGSGKTIVAAIAMYAVFLNSKKTIFMAPTQILANQHYETLKKLFKNSRLPARQVKIGLVTSSVKINSDAYILIGTHSLLSKNIETKNVGLVVIDEQHKFGVEQRNVLVKKTNTPHVLTMTATPIPRTVATLLLGDLDLSILDEMPKGRQKIITWIVPETKRENGFKWIHEKIKNEKVQAYIICPLIETSENETMKDIKNVNTEYVKLHKNFPDLEIGLLHGKLKSNEKNMILDKFSNQKMDVLLSTPIVEVGIDIPNATIMVIEGADRFGLASLHQLRGRVGRGKLKSYCLLLTENESQKTKTRLSALKENQSGFKLAELDLQMRGPGEIYGSKQSGIPELKIANWNDIQTIKETRQVAESMLK